MAGRAENLKPWQPGQSGNPGGRPRKRLVDEALVELLEADEGRNAEAIARVLVERAAKGNIRAAQFIAERTQGKPKQKVEDSGQGVQAGVAVRFVSAAVTPEMDLSRLSDEQLKQLEELIALAQGEG